MLICTAKNGNVLINNWIYFLHSKIEILKICESCGKTFTAYKTTTRYCSHTCNTKSYKKEQRGYKMTAISYRTMQNIERISNQYEKIKDKEYLSVSETAFLLSVGRMTIYRYLHLGKLKAVQMGGKTFIRRADIDEKFDKSEEYKSRPTSIMSPEFCTAS